MPFPIRGSGSGFLKGAFLVLALFVEQALVNVMVCAKDYTAFASLLVTPAHGVKDGVGKTASTVSIDLSG